MSNDIITMPCYNLEPSEIREELSALYQALSAAGVELADLSPAERSILIAVNDPDTWGMTQEEVSKRVGLQPKTITRLLHHEAFRKAYFHIQAIMQLAHLPEIDNTTFKKAKSMEGTDKDRDLAYRRLGIFDGKKGGLNINVVNNNQVQAGARDESSRICPADELFESLGVEEIKPRRKTIDYKGPISD